MRSHSLFSAAAATALVAATGLVLTGGASAEGANARAVQATGPDGPTSAAPGPGRVLSLQADGLTSRPGADGVTTVVLHDATDYLTTFTHGKSPRLSVTLRELTGQWRSLGFDAAPPLATIDPQGDRRQATLVRLGQPRLRGDDLVVPATPVPDARGGALAGRLDDRADAVPDDAGSTTVTIDATGADAEAFATIDDPLTSGRDGEWKPFEAYIVAYSDDGRCSGTFGGSNGSCDGRARGGTGPFSGQDSIYASVQWSRGTAEMIVTASYGYGGATPHGELVGSIPQKASDQLFVDRGWLWDAQNFKVRSGTDPAKTGDIGGPLRIDAEYHSRAAGAGYTFQINGWLWCMVGEQNCAPG